jgi:hypothetical protein
MDRTNSLMMRREAARYLADSRIKMQSDDMRTCSKKRIPQPVSLPDTSGKDQDEIIESDSSEIDTNETLSDRGADTVEGEAANGHIPMDIEGHHLSARKQKAIQDLDLVLYSSEELEASEDNQDKEINKDIDDVDSVRMDTKFHPELPASEMTPPTPKSSHLELPLLSIETKAPVDCANENPDVLMDASEETDMSNVPQLNAVVSKPPLFSEEVDSCCHTSGQATGAPMPDYEDGESSKVIDALTTFLKGMSTSERAFPLIGDVLQEAEGADFWDITHRIRQQTWWPDVKQTLHTEGYLKNCTSSATPTQAPSLQHVTVHVDGSTEVPTSEPKEAALPKQHAAVVPDTLSPSSENVKQQGTFDPALKIFMEDMEQMESETLAKFQEEEVSRKTRCLAHNWLNSEHYYGSIFAVPLRIRQILSFVTNRERRSRGYRRFTFDQIKKIRDYRDGMPQWKKHAVWKRSLLATEIR